MDAVSEQQVLERNKTLATVIYALYAAAPFVGVTGIVAIILNYLKRDDVRGTWLESHFRWQIRTFWTSLLLGLAAVLTFFVGIGIAIAFGSFIWFIYRIVKGWLALSENKPMY